MLVRLKKRFWDKVAVSGLNDCWEWLGYVTPKGLPKFSYNGKPEGAARVAYLLTRGELPQGLEVCHQCDNKKCCNPIHLWLGTHKENMEDLVSKGYKLPAKGESHGRAKLTEFQVQQIRKDNRTQLEIAQDYGISRSMVSHIKKKLSWSHI